MYMIVYYKVHLLYYLLYTFANKIYTRATEHNKPHIDCVTRCFTKCVYSDAGEKCFPTVLLNMSTASHTTKVPTDVYASTEEHFPS